MPGSGLLFMIGCVLILWASIILREWFNKPLSMEDDKQHEFRTALQELHNLHVKALADWDQRFFRETGKWPWHSNMPMTPVEYAELLKPGLFAQTQQAPALRDLAAIQAQLGPGSIQQQQMLQNALGSQQPLMGGLGLQNLLPPGWMKQ